MSSRLVSEDAPARGQERLGPFEVRFAFEPHAGERPGGDRFVVERRVDGALCFAVADATGHGAWGAAFWARHRATFDDGWSRWLAGEIDLRGFARAFNEALRAPGPLDAARSYLCLALGALSPDGALEWANFGWGTHVLPSGPGGPWWQDDPAALFGLKLGWLDGPSWDRLPRAFVLQRVERVRRVVLLTDAFLGDDHADPEATLALVRDLGVRVATLPAAEVVPAVLALPHADDDATVLAIDRY